MQEVNSVILESIRRRKEARWVRGSGKVNHLPGFASLLKGIVGNGIEDFLI